MYRCWANREHYNEDRYLQRLQATQAKLLQYLDPAPPPTN